MTGPRPDIVEQELARIRGAKTVDVEAELAAIRKKGPSDRERAARARAREAQNEAERTDRTVGEQLATLGVTALDDATFGLAGLATDLVTSGALNPWGVGGTESFQNARDSRRREREMMPTRDRVAAGLIGGLSSPINAVLPGGATAVMLGKAAPGAGTATIAGRGLLEGVVQGGAAAIGENIGTSDPYGTQVAAGAGFGGLLGSVAAPLATRLGKVGASEFFDPIRQYAPDFLGGTAARERRLAELAANKARTELNVSQDLDARLGRPVPVLPSGPGMPSPMEIDVAGPNVVSRARGATSTVSGRDVAREAFDARSAQMPQALTGDAPNALRTENALKAARKAQADADYSAAVEATKGIPINTPSLGALLRTPTGSAAWKAVLQERPDLVLAEGDPARNLPLVTTFVGPDLVDVPVPDAEAVHLMTRYLRSWAKGEKGQVFPDGVSAESAKNALKLLEKMKDELPAPFRVANENYARASQAIEAIEMGRTRWRVNPTANKKANRVAVENVETAMRGMSPENQAFLREGKRFDIATRINEGRLTPEGIVQRLDRPGSSFAAEARIAGGPIPARARAWAATEARQKQVVPSGVPGVEPRTGGLLATTTDVLSPWWKRTAINVARRVIGESSQQNSVLRSATDAEIMRLVTSPPGTIERELSKMSARDRAAVEKAMQAVGFMARVEANASSSRSQGLLAPR